MEKLCEKEMYDMEICDQCFLRSNEYKNDDWFTKVCNPPHLLVWAKASTHPFWPAKVIARARNKLDVRFFGQHEMSIVHPNNCFLFSWENPNRLRNQRIRSDIDTIMKVIHFKYANE